MNYKKFHFFYTLMQESLLKKEGDSYICKGMAGKTESCIDCEFKIECFLEYRTTVPKIMCEELDTYIDENPEEFI